MSWIKVTHELPNKPEVWRIAEILEIEPDAVIGKLIRVWSWFDQHTTDGIVPNVTVALLNRYTGVTGFVEAMIEVGWVVVVDDGLRLPGFDVHCGVTAKGRAQTAKRVAQHRARKDPATSPERAAIPAHIRAKIMERDGGRCVYCGRAEGERGPLETPRDSSFHLDHVVPLSRGGEDAPFNLVAACNNCNRYKANRTPDECGLEWPMIDGKKAGYKSVTKALPDKSKNKRNIKEKKTAPENPFKFEQKAEWPGGNQVPEAWIQEAAVKKPEVDWETEGTRFVNHHRKKGDRFKDWRAAWWSWVHNPFEKTPAGSGGPDLPKF